MIHIVNGDAVGSRLNVEGEVIIWREMYDWGPLHYEWDAADLIGRRAAFFEEQLELPASLFIKTSQEQWKALHRMEKHEEVVLWFEHDRYDQTMLMYLLHELRNSGHRLSMVTLDSHPEVDRFYGMGQLSEEQLLALEKTKQPVTPEQVEEAVEGWRAYASPQLSKLEQWILESVHTLPYLKEAMVSHLDYIPCGDKGLSIVEEWILLYLDGHIRTFHDLLREIQSRRNDGISDFYLSYLLKQLGTLVEVEGALPDFTADRVNPNLTLSSKGKEVLEGKRSRIDIIGLDTWVGGARLYCSKQEIEDDWHVGE
ncbi:DUF1835 domain-containing protein [Halobacillus salinus]|uniref:DUF1835 domain-containing protein n=1 Tax=Halobacillus salinus TaxID=192814 RepID=UPI0013052A85|nr:DUF1835 domain-containing protein [Halobacillus salinus]